MIEYITKAFTALFGTKSERDLKELLPYVDKVNQAHARLTTISDDELRGETGKLRAAIDQHLAQIDQELNALHERVANEPDLDIDQKEEIFNQIDKLEDKRDEELEKVLLEVLPQAFAIVKETARRLKEHGKLVVKATFHDEQIAAKKQNVTVADGKATWANKWLVAGNEITWDMVHYDVQLIGGVVLHQGKIAEMATGEGKTLVATLPSFLNGLARRGVHIVTVNDYLAKRDCEWMAPLMEFHGLTVDCIDKYPPHSEGRVKAYLADITYGTNNEFGFDYLRDNMSRSLDEQVQRKHHYAMVDEVDSVLVDDARTPLIISGPVPKGDEQDFVELRPRVLKLVETQRKLTGDLLNEAKRLIKEGNTEEGGLALFRAYRGMPKYKPLIKFLSETGIRQVLQKTENIYLQENAKLMPEADKPLYFTIDEKNNLVDLTERGLELITLENEDDNFFVLPDIAVALDAIEKNTALADNEKLKKKDDLIIEYTAKTQRIHTVHQLLKAYALFEKDVDYIVVDSKVKIVDEQTGRVMEGRRYSDGLHQALEAKENVKVEDATQTYATITLQNYFRMYHKLAGMTGTAETEAGEFWEIYKLDVVVIPTNRKIVREDREDKVYKTIREKYNAVVDEIQDMVNKGRPILVGTTSVENSEILSRMLQLRKIQHQVLNAKQHAKEAEIVAFAGLPGTVTIATNMAGRGTDIKLHPDSRKAGGLAIIGTERHESRRVDRQLRGRSGRQGDPGSSQFFVSLEDNLMRLFGSERIARIMDRLGLEEGEVIQHSMITKSIERAQKKVEENNFAMRKRLLEYDDVMNMQRERIYRRRKNALIGERLELDTMNNFYEVAKNLIDSTIGDYDGFKLNAMHALGIEAVADKDAILKGTNTEQLTQLLYEQAFHAYQRKKQAIIDQVMPFVSQVYQEKGAVVEDIAVPFTDGVRTIGVVSNLKKTYETQGKELMKKMEQIITLAIIDQGWKEHLREMDELKEQVQNARFENKDPLLVYKFEAFELFKDFVARLNGEMVSFFSKCRIPVENPSDVRPAQRQAPPKQRLTESRSEEAAKEAPDANSQPAAPPRDVEVTKPRKTERIIGRNDKVNVRYADGTTKTGVKYKTVEKDLESNLCVLVD